MINQNKFNKNLIFTDGIIVLKPFKLKDAKLHLSGEDKEQQKWLSGGKSNLKSVEDWIKKNRKYWKNEGPIFNLAVWDKEILVGMVEANIDKEKIEGMKKGQANISYGIYPKYRGKGYAARVVNLFLKILKSKKVTYALIRVNPKNVKSLKIPIKCGFKESGKIKTREGNTLKLFTKKL